MKYENKAGGLCVSNPPAYNIKLFRLFAVVNG